MRSEDGKPRPDQRLAQRYHFIDPDMDMFFVAALGWGPAGGLDIGQAFHVASQITDGVGESWVEAFGNYGDKLNAQANAWKQRGWKRAAGEARLQAFASYRSAWQFAEPGQPFASLYARHQAAFVTAMEELGMPATFFQAPFEGQHLPGAFFQHAKADAPIAFVIGGADTCFEDLFLTVGRHLFEHGYSVALVDLPGQGITQGSGLHWRADAEKPIAAVIDVLIDRFKAVPGRIALIGLSLGGYFAARAASYETRLATVIASTPFPNPAQLFALSVRSAMENAAKAAPSPAAARARRVTLWKAGAKSAEEFLAKTAGMVANPVLVQLPFLSLLGAGDSPIFAAQAHEWHERIRSNRKSFVLLDETTGADGHVQVNNRRRLGQEVSGWMDEIFIS